MDYQPNISGWLVLFFVIWGGLGLLVNSALFCRLWVTGGKVGTEAFGPPDSGLVCFFATWFAWLVYNGFAAPQRAVNVSDLMVGALHVSVIVLVIVLFLVFRKINVLSLLGLNFGGLLKAFFLALPLVLAAFPLVAFAGALMAKLMGSEAEPQELVKFFTEAANSREIGVLLLTMVFGVLVAPAAEEFIFRGYLYSVAKKYLGFIPAMILVSLLFAAIHLNLTSLPSLFILALCFTLAYELTGSILVPIAMHALFNFSEFALMLSASHS